MAAAPEPERPEYTFYFPTKGGIGLEELDCCSIVYKIKDAIPRAREGDPCDDVEGNSEDDFMVRQRPAWRQRAPVAPPPRVVDRLEPLPLPDPADPPASALGAALAQTRWPLSSEKKMSGPEAEAFVSALTREGMGPVLEGLRTYIEVLRSRGVAANIDQITELIAFGLPWVEMVCEDPSLVQQIRDYQNFPLASMLGLTAG